MVRRHLLTVTMALLLVVGAVAPPEATADAQRTVTYEVRTRGTVHADPEGFAVTVGRILTDARGWALGGSVRFRRVASGGELVVELASPSVIEAAHPVCDRDFSCRVGDRVLLHDGNWRWATAAWREAGGSLDDYRRYVLYHEIGHWWGFGHVGCPGPGAPAPIMLQQSISLQGCRPNAWPLDAERRRLASQLGVTVRPSRPLPPGLRGQLGWTMA
jgi:hypothetical protein